MYCPWFMIFYYFFRSHPNLNLF